MYELEQNQVKNGIPDKVMTLLYDMSWESSNNRLTPFILDHRK